MLSADDDTRLHISAENFKSLSNHGHHRDSSQSLNIDNPADHHIATADHHESWALQRILENNSPKLCRAPKI